MASALMAFVQGLGAEKPNEDIQVKKASPVKDVIEVDEDDEDMFEDSDHMEEAPQKSPTLLDVAKQESSPSLMQVAKTIQFEDVDKHQDLPKPTSLSQLAAEINHEEHERETRKVQRALDVASSEVRAERVTQRSEQVSSGLKAAVEEQQQQYDDDEFEEDAASVRAAAETLAASVTKAKAQSKGQRSPSQSRAKAPSKSKNNSMPSASKVEMQRAMQNKLSAFQLQQLSLTQRRLFLASLAQAGDANTNKAKKHVAKREALNELAKDKRTQQRQKRKPQREFARLDDNRHCHFTPRLRNSSSKKKVSSNDSDNEDGPGGRDAVVRRNEDFVRRMEAAERARREQLRRTREEAAYLDRVDKKECPSCGNPQSYSELTQKRKKCPNCGVTYKSRIAWSDVADDFLTRMEEFQHSRKERLREKQEEHDRIEALSCGPESADDTKKTWDEVRDEFLGRMQLDLEYREISRAAIWEEIQHECSFSPSISRRAQQMELGDFEERMRRDLEERRQRHEQFAMKMEAARARERDFHNRPASVKSKHKALSASFQERLRQDIEKRRARGR